MHLIRLSVAAGMIAAAQAASAGEAPPEPAGVSFLGDVAPILRKHCVGCHNPRRTEGRYDLTTFAGLSEGARGGESAFAPGDPAGSHLVDLIRPDGQPRMPFKQPPISEAKRQVLERWIAQGARYDGEKPSEDWLALLRKRSPAAVPDSYPAPVAIAALAFRPDGRALLASGYHEVNTWDVADGRLGPRLRGFGERVHDIAVSPDGKLVAVASGDPGQGGSARILRFVEGTIDEGRSLVETADGVFAIAFSPDSRLVAAAGADRTVRIWEAETSKLVRTIEDHADWILDLAFSPDGKRIATASRDKTSKVFDVAGGETVATFPGHAETVSAVAYSPDGKFIATGGDDNQVRLWNPDNDAKQAGSLTGFGGGVFRIAYTADGRDLVATSADGIVRVFRDGARRLELKGHTDWVYALAISPDGARLASGSWDGTVLVWDLAEGKPLLNFQARPGPKTVSGVTAAQP
ncbi:c-type cytochrome domain-containing protein [Isosphaeraceae bacterium EP7]